MAKTRKTRGKTNPGGELPGEYMRKTLVTVPLPMLAEDHLSSKATHYIVVTSRLDWLWGVKVEHEGEQYELPHRVVLQIQRHIASIVKAQRIDRGREQASLLRLMKNQHEEPIKEAL